MKKIYLLLLSLACFTINMRGQSMSGTTGDCTWYLDEDWYTLTISGNGAMADYDYGEAPWLAWDNDWGYISDWIMEIVIGNGVTHIGNNAFEYCWYVPTLDIPASVASIGEYAFYSCDGLESVTVHWTSNLPTVESTAFDLYDLPLSKVILNVPAGTYALYAADPIWGQFNIKDPGGSSVVSVSGVSVSPASVTLNVGQTQALTATVTPSDATNQNVTWSSSDESIATVSSTGTVTAVAAGTATITVTTEDGGYTATCTVTVNPIAVTGVSVSPTSVTLSIGQTRALTATVTPSNAANKNVTWSSSNASVATVSSDGTVTAVAAGTATITVTTADGGYTATCTITVNSATVDVTGVSVSPTSVTLNVGQTQALTATVTPSDATNQNVTWSSSDASVATVSSDGTVTAVAAGTATITVTTEDGGYTATCTITVNQATVDVTGVTLDKTSISIMNHSTAQLTATVLPDNADNKSVIWSTSDASIATVSSTGLVTAVGEGEATITVTTVSGFYTATCAVTVTHDTGLDAISSEVKVYVQDGNLYVESPVVEKVSVYSISGTMLYTAVKPAGKALITLDAARNGIFVIKGTGWVKKAVK
ncbi:MAG: Ig-like domain-containing protein [Dysgonamonadaceae bacterium]|jgi:uncharacterized protein YjdB|nr:Ig-like domain-containing protein [Dysgonamonadaceae bacterium]